MQNAVKQLGQWDRGAGTPSDLREAVRHLAGRRSFRHPGTVNDLPVEHDRFWRVLAYSRILCASAVFGKTPDETKKAKAYAFTVIAIRIRETDPNGLGGQLNADPVKISRPRPTLGTLRDIAPPVDGLTAPRRWCDDAIGAPDAMKTAMTWLGWGYGRRSSPAASSPLPRRQASISAPTLHRAQRRDHHRLQAGIGKTDLITMYFISAADGVRASSGAHGRQIDLREADPLINGNT